MNAKTTLERFGIKVKGPEERDDDVVDRRWRLESQIGYGAFGKVFKARDVFDGEVAALKIFSENFEATGYLQELGLMFDESHPNVVKTLSFGYTSGRKYIVYEYVGGGSLRDYLVRYPRVPPDIAVAVIREAALGLAFAHSRNVVHRDLKPENILLTGADWPFSVKLCDFGLSARCSQSDRLASSFGSPAYMAPEQFEGDYDYRIDFYALGVILYEMLFGRRPLSGDASSISYAHKNLEIKLPESGPPTLLKLLRRMLAKNPEERFNDARELVREIDESVDAIQSRRETTELARPKLSQLTLREKWRANLPGGIDLFSPSRDGQLLLFASGRVAAVKPSGKFVEIIKTAREIENFIEGSSVDGTIGWIADGKVWCLRDNLLRDWLLEPEIIDSPSRFLLSPSGQHLLAVTPRYLYLYTVDGYVQWRATIETYGTLPPVAFSATGKVVWVATEAPRTQLLAVDVEGHKLCRTAAPGTEVDLHCYDDRHVVATVSGKRDAHLVSVDGFIESSVEVVEEALSLHEMGGSVAISSMGHIEVLDPKSLQSRALIEHPNPEEFTLFVSEGIYQIAVTGKGTQVRFSALTDG